MNITILGAGAWGTALGVSLAARHQVVLWGRDPSSMQNLVERRENSHYLPRIVLPQSLVPTADFDHAIGHVVRAGSTSESLLISAVPVAGLRSLAQSLASASSSKVPNLIWLCKGFEESTRLLPHQIVHEVLGADCLGGALSGPSFAQEVAVGLPCALTFASTSAQLCEAVVAAVHGGNIRVYSTDDLAGVEVAGAVKNILAIATGIADGLGLGLNARAALITRGLVEIARLGTALGGKPETFMGLAGMGDLILTCTGDLSRNRTVGLNLAQGKKLDVIVAELGHVAEGVRCASAVRQLAHDLNIEMPIANAVAGVLFDGDSPRDMVGKLLSRCPKGEAGN